MATHSSIPAWKIPQRDLVGYSSRHYEEYDTTEHAKAKKNKPCVNIGSLILTNVMP